MSLLQSTVALQDELIDWVCPGCQKNNQIFIKEWSPLPLGLLCPYCYAVMQTEIWEFDLDELEAELLD